MKKMKSLGLGLVVMALVALLCSVNTAWGQDVTATITGTVTDPSGAALAGVTVTAKETDRGTIWTAQTNEAGIFSLLRIPIGIYELKAEMKGFKTAVRPSLTLDLNQTARVDFKMAMGQVTETIEVTSEAPLLQADNATVGTIIDAATNEALPLATRNYVELTLLSPGAVTPNPSSFNTGDNVGSGGRPFINGNREQSNNFILDGMDNNQVSDNLLGYTPPYRVELMVVEINANGPSASTTAYFDDLSLRTRSYTGTAPSRFYAVDGLNFKVLDVTNPALPTLLSTTTDYGAQRVAVGGTKVFLATPALTHTDPTGGISVLDVSVLPPTLVTHLMVPGTTQTVTATASYVYAGDSTSVADVITLGQ